MFTMPCRVRCPSNYDHYYLLPGCRVVDYNVVVVVAMRALRPRPTGSTTFKLAAAQNRPAQCNHGAKIVQSPIRDFSIQLER
jgi:hypothetical protein